MALLSMFSLCSTSSSFTSSSLAFLFPLVVDEDLALVGGAAVDVETFFERVVGIIQYINAIVLLVC